MSAPSRAALFRPGDLFAGRYRVERLLGEGGMGTVYQVVDERLDDHVALKIMRFCAGDEEDIKRFEREVRLARRITHPNVARTHDIGEDGGLHFLTMELIDGDSLDDLLEERKEACSGRRGPFAPAEVVELAIPMALGLAAAHAAQVVHRDLKPPNIMVVPAKGVRAARLAITDFGVARAAEGGAETTRPVGTPLYMAPEQLLGVEVGPAADIYAFGVVLYELLTGQLPFEGATPMAVALARCHQPPVDPRRHVDVPAALADLVLACLRTSPADRIASADVAATALRAYARAASAETVMFSATHSLTPSQLGAAHESGVSLASSGPLSISSPFAPMSPGKRALAVLPFEYRGPADMDFLGESLAQELVDMLSRTRGLRVLGFGAARARMGEGDPRAIGRALGADVVVTGSVQGGGGESDGRVRVSVRLIEVDSGVQIWSARFDKRFEDVIEMQDIVSQRIADALRLEVNLIEQRGRATPEAVELYLRAKRTLDTRFYVGGFEAMTLLERAIELSPDFAPAAAYYAIAAIHAWWVDILGSRRGDWPELTKAAVERSLAIAPGLAESHLAAAMHALQHGDLKTSARELANALDIAPTLALAHRYLAELQCEAGRANEGIRRARLALELDPSMHGAHFCIARHLALQGDHPGWRRELDEMAAALGNHHSPVLILSVRFAVWFDALDSIEALLDDIRSSNEPMHVFVRQIVSYIKGDIDGAVMARMLELSHSFGNARLVAVFHQFLAEAHAARGDHGAALDVLDAAKETSLVDIAWLERCPLFEPVRRDPRFVDVMARVRARAHEIWELQTQRS